MHCNCKHVWHNPNCRFYPDGYYLGGVKIAPLPRPTLVVVLDPPTCGPFLGSWSAAPQ